MRSSSHSAAGFQFALTILVFAAAGWALDRWLDSSPWLLLAALGLGFVGALVSLVKRVPMAAPRKPRDR